MLNKAILYKTLGNNHITNCHLHFSFFKFILLFYLHYFSFCSFLLFLYYCSSIFRIWFSLYFNCKIKSKEKSFDRFVKCFWNWICKCETIYCGNINELILRKFSIILPKHYPRLGTPTLHYKTEKFCHVEVYWNNLYFLNEQHQPFYGKNPHTADVSNMWV